MRASAAKAAPLQKRHRANRIFTLWPILVGDDVILYSTGKQPERSSQWRRIRAKFRSLNHEGHEVTRRKGHEGNPFADILSCIASFSTLHDVKSSSCSSFCAGNREADPPKRGFAGGGGARLP